MRICVVSTLVGPNPKLHVCSSNYLYSTLALTGLESRFYGAGSCNPTSLGSIILLVGSEETCREIPRLTVIQMYLKTPIFSSDPTQRELRLLCSNSGRGSSLVGVNRKIGLFKYSFRIKMVREGDTRDAVYTLRGPNQYNIKQVQDPLPKK
jgi:hypothetical protein